MLNHLYPNHEKDVEVILGEIRKVMELHGYFVWVEKSFVKDLAKDKSYLSMPCYQGYLSLCIEPGKSKSLIFRCTLFKETNKSSTPYRYHLPTLFQQTPASFALSYFSLYMDYEYPIHGTADLVKRSRNISYSGG
jgi:hypothetical protein